MQKTEIEGNPSAKSFQIPGSAITYKQALRGLFVAGTSPVHPGAAIREKVGNKPRLNHASRRDVLHNLAGKNRKQT